MSTLTEIEAAVATLPREEKERLHLHLEEQLARDAARERRERRLAALDALQKSLALDQAKMQRWMDAVKDARR